MEKYLIAKYETYGREPIIRRMKDGSIICLFLSGGPLEPHNENIVTICKSVDNGKTWSEPKILFSHSCRGCWSTELFCEGDKDFAVVHTYNMVSWYRELQTFRSFCDESGENWSEPQSFSGGINGCSIRQGITLSNGDWIFPLYWQETRNDFDFWAGKQLDLLKIPFVSGVGISSDKGETFSRHGYIACDVPLWEPNIVETEPGHVIMYCRCNKGFLYISESFDYGRTWSKGYLSDIPNPDSKVTVLKVNGSVIMINNFSSTNERINLCICKSADGKTFEKIMNLEDKDALFFYPHAFADEKEKILYVAYENKKDHWLAKIPFDELGI